MELFEKKEGDGEENDELKVLVFVQFQGRSSVLVGRPIESQDGAVIASANENGISADEVAREGIGVNDVARDGNVQRQSQIGSGGANEKIIFRGDGSGWNVGGNGQYTEDIDAVTGWPVWNVKK